MKSHVGLVGWRWDSSVQCSISLFLITGQIWNDFKDLNSKLLGTCEIGEEEKNSNLNKT
jgi:hypothetical protein